MLDLVVSPLSLSCKTDWAGSVGTLLWQVTWRLQASLEICCFVFVCWTVISIAAAYLQSFQELKRFKEPRWCVCVFLISPLCMSSAASACGICHSTLEIDSLGLRPRLEERKTGVSWDFKCFVLLVCVFRYSTSLREIHLG